MAELAALAVAEPKPLPTLETLALAAVPDAVLFQFLKDFCGPPIAKLYLPMFIKRLTKKQLQDMALTIPWDHPLAREMDFALHKRRLKGKTTF